MENIANDPIIGFYMKMSNSTDNETEVPLFSETMLRLSFKEVFGSMRPLFPKELQLYRKLLLFNFSENYTSITDLVSIMTCFDEAQIREYFDKHESIIGNWQKFLKESLLSVLLKEALNEILCEYTRRHLALFGELPENKVKKKALDVAKFLRFENKLPKQWYRAFNSVLQNRLERDKRSQINEDLSVDDLKISNIFSDIKERLNVLVVEEVSKYENEFSSEPAAKKAKTDELQVINVEFIASSDDNNVDPEIQNESNANVETYDIDTEFKVANESDLNEEEYEYNSSCNEQQVEIVNQQDKPQEILQKVVIVNEDDSEYSDNEKTLSEPGDNDEKYENTNYIKIYDISKSENGNTNDSDSTKTEDGIVSKDKALSYLAALQAYVVVNGHFQAIELLDKVDSLLRETI